MNTPALVRLNYQRTFTDGPLVGITVPMVISHCDRAHAEKLAARGQTFLVDLSRNACRDFDYRISEVTP